MASSVGFLYDPCFLDHEFPGHPERPERLAAAVAELERAGLLGRFVAVPARAVTREELLAAHGAAHVDNVRAVTRAPDGVLDDDTYTSEGTWQAATGAAGGTIDVVRGVANGAFLRGLALPRPPGHHATADHAMGFCVFNNVAVAARALRPRRVAIVDFDVHHGNGTQDIFYHDPGVLFISTHQAPLYPGTGHLHESGAGPGVGTTINVPLPPGSGDDALLEAHDEVVVPAVRRFAPDILLVSAGFDGHWRDPLAGHAMTLEGYGSLARRLVGLADEVCGGRVVVVLEGGYDLGVLAHGVANVARALLGEPLADDPIGPHPLGASTHLGDVVAQVLMQAGRLAAEVPGP